MESIALILAILLLYFLILYANTFNNKYYVLAEIIYIILPYIHERYIALLPLFILIQIIHYIRTDQEYSGNRLRKLIINLTIPILCVIVFFTIRGVLLNNQLLVGTGGTNINDTLNIKQVFTYIVSQITYIFGFNVGGSYLNGVDFKSVPLLINILIILVDCIILFIVIRFIKEIIEDKKNQKQYLINSLIFITFIILCIISSSITIRVEMRWIYVSYTATLIFIGYMISIISHSARKSKINYILLSVCILLLSFPIEIYYKSNYKNLYFWPTLEQSNSLYNVTYNRYKEELWKKRLIIWNSNYNLNNETAINFFQPFNPNINESNFDLYIVNNYSEVIEYKNDNSIIIVEDEENRGYFNATKLMTNLKLFDGQIIDREGYYLDNWIGKKAEIVLYTETGNFMLNLYNLFTYDKSQTGVLYVNDIKYYEYDFVNPTIDIPITVTPGTTVNIKFENNYSCSSPPDIRELCFLLEISN